MLFDCLIQIRDPEPHSAALNMALDETLLATASEPLVRVYRWIKPAVSFGYFGKYTPVAAAWPDCEIVRRMTGGGIVEHGTDITYTHIIPAAHPSAQRGARRSYRAIHSALADWLQQRGIAASLASAPAGRGGGICFQDAAESDVVSAGRKLAGAAQRRTRHGTLHQGSMQGIPGEWRATLATAFASHIESRDFTPAEIETARRLASEKYATAAWTQRV